MDPVSQGAIGATFAVATIRRKKVASIALIGAVAGLAPDIDVFFQSASDPLLFLEYHRQFTHSLIFIPFGALIVALLARFLLRPDLDLRTIYLSALAGYATHGLLDSFTSYGTQLFWPFSDYRVAWDNISIVDPLFTLPLLVTILIAIRYRSNFVGVIGMAWALAYLLFGFSQYNRAMGLAESLAKSRGHEIKRLDAKPSFGNSLLFKTIYETDGFYHVDSIRVGFDALICEGARIKKLDLETQYPDLSPSDKQFEDVERFRWFSDDYLAVDSKNRIFDMRYSMLPNEIDPMWGITLDLENPLEHVQWWTDRSLNSEERGRFFDLLRKESCPERK